MARLLIAAKIYKGIGIAGDSLTSVPEQFFYLCDILYNNDIGDFPAPHGTEKIQVRVRQGCIVG